MEQHQDTCKKTRFLNSLKNIFKLNKTGNNIKVNQSAPNFSLPDESGNIISLAEFRGTHNVFLFFIRGDFCPYCQMMLRAYQKEREKFHQKNVMMLSIGPGPLASNLEMVKKFELEYKVLWDAQQKTIKQYGSLDEDDKRAFPEGMPIPASFLIDRKGIVRFCSRADNAEEAFNPSAVFGALELLS